MKRRGRGKGRGRERKLQQRAERQLHDPNFHQYNAFLKEAHYCDERGDLRRSADNYLGALLCSPNVWAEMRWVTFMGYYMSMGGDGRKNHRCLPTNKDIRGLEEGFLNNEREPILFRAYSAFLLAQLSSYENDEERATFLCQRCLSLIQGLSVSEGRRKMPDSLMETIEVNLQKLARNCQNMLDWLTDETRIAQLQENARRFSTDPIGFVAERAGVSVEETEQTLKFASQHPMKMEPPKITSKVMSQIQDLPEREVVFYIHKKASDGEEEIQEKLAALSVGYKNTQAYHVFMFNQHRFDSGCSAKRVFKLVSKTMCDPKEARPKHLLSTFCHACLEPAVFSASIVGAKKVDPYRPQALMFETEEDVAETARFLKLMGYNVKQVGVLNKSAQMLLNRNFNEVVEKVKGMVDEKVMPHLSDRVVGIECGYCGNVGPQLVVCLCRKAYYCNKTCQREHWETHEKEHKAAMDKKKKSW